MSGLTPFHSAPPGAGDAQNSNKLSLGDNPEALKALLPNHVGRVKR